MDMNDLLSKISSYNLLNHLLPGALFGYWIESRYSLNSSTDIITKIFIYYFLGIIIGRIGSLAIFPILKCLKIIKFEDYGAYIEASKADKTIQVLSETNNQYRTLISLLIIISFLELLEYIHDGRIKVTILENLLLTGKLNIEIV